MKHVLYNLQPKVSIFQILTLHMTTNKSFLLLNTTFLVIFICDTLTWKNHTESIIPKLCTVCCVMRSLKAYLSHNSLWIVYYSYLHSIMNYGLLFWRNVCIVQGFLG